ncbi:MAG: flippase-like domain-containing protein [Kyrpidia tusciae]|nr:lysylphosphatidylglycerol synthase transmembrane domain-containing protein [Kyrpidia tusciae]MBE3552759.1 flippase-like domain-containing protein [Kyrpidia tusciae]
MADHLSPDLPRESGTTNRIWLWVWLGALVLGVSVALWFYRDELWRILDVIRHASPTGTLLAVACETGFLLTYWDLVGRLYRAAGTPVPRGALFRLLLVSGVIDRLLPTAGTSTIAVLAVAGARWGVTWASTLWMMGLFTSLGLVATLLIVALSVVLLSTFDIPLPPSIHQALLVGRWAAIGGVVLGAGFLWTPVRRRAVRRIMHWIGGLIHWWKAHEPAWWKRWRARRGHRTSTGSPNPGATGLPGEISPAQATSAPPSSGAPRRRRRIWDPEERFRAFEATWERIRREPGLWGAALAENLLLYVLRIGTLAAFISALHISLPWHHLIAGYGLVVLLVNLSALPFSLGIFEVSMAALYHWLGVPWPQSWALTLAYRGITFWLPIPLGLLAMVRWPGQPPSPGPRPYRNAGETSEQ